MERLTPAGGLSIALCPSIALVAQLRREYLQHADTPIRALAVCSDETAGYDPKKESSRNTAADPTLDNSNVSASEVKGAVTTNAAEIAQWIQAGKDTPQISVIFGTYQSGHRIAEALQSGGASASVLIADEAHRTAGLRRKRKDDDNKRLRDFTLCHDNNAFPAKYRVYQTATPRIYDTRKLNRNNDKPGDWIVRTMDDETIFGVELYRKSYIEAVQNGWLSDYRIIAIGVNDDEAYKEAKPIGAEHQEQGTPPAHHRRLPARLGFRAGNGRRYPSARRIRIRRRQRPKQRHPHQILHRLYEHRRQVQEYGGGSANPRRQRLGAGLAQQECPRRRAKRRRRIFPGTP